MDAPTLGSNPKSNGISAYWQKLGLDYAGIARPVVGMATDAPADYETIALLCTRAGMIMEDVAAEAVTMPPLAPTDLRNHLHGLNIAAKDIAALPSAAEVLARRE